MTSESGSRATRLLLALRQASGGRRKLYLNDIWEAFAQASPELRGQSEGRLLLAKLLSQLEDRDALSLPRTKKLWEQVPSPPLPRWVQLPKHIPPAQEKLERARIPWAPELAFVATSTLTTSDAELLALQAFFRDGGRDRPMVPLRERSIGIFGDEKRLDALSKTQLFGHGRLTLDALRCYAMSPPLVWEPGPSRGGPLLVVENHHTWESLKRYNNEAEQWSGVVYGAGKHVLSSIGFLSALARERHALLIEYFGDLDGEGIRIPARAADLSAEAGAPPIQPAADLYTLLLTHGQARHDSKGGKGNWRDAITWLGHGLSQRVAPLLERGERMAQEWVGWEVLSAALG